MSRFRLYHLALALVATGLAVGNAQAAIITAWNFENDAVAVNNNPAPSTGVGTASSIGMNIYPTPNVGVTTDDVLVGKNSDTGSDLAANTTQTWRVRAQAGTMGAANGWSSLAPIGTQGAVFAASTVGYSGPINISFDWYVTNQAEAEMQVEYTNNGTTWQNLAVTLPSVANTYAAVMTNTTAMDPNLVNGSYVAILNDSGQDWFPGITATITDPLAANNPNFAFEVVNAATGADVMGASGMAYNNNSGNWRFDNISISGAAVPEPSSLCLGGLALLGLAFTGLRRKK